MACDAVRVGSRDGEGRRWASGEGLREENGRKTGKEDREKNGEVGGDGGVSSLYGKYFCPGFVWETGGFGMETRLRDNQT